MHTARLSGSGGGVCPTPGGLPPPSVGNPPWRQTPYPAGRSPCEQTDTWKNITLPQTSFASSNKYLFETEFVYFLDTVSEWCGLLLACVYYYVKYVNYEYERIPNHRSAISNYQYSSLSYCTASHLLFIVARQNKLGVWAFLFAVSKYFGWMWALNDFINDLQYRRY